MVFSKAVDREEVIRRLKEAGARRVTVLACPYCASISISKERGLPFYDPQRALFTTTGMAVETRELKERLEAEGFRVEVHGTAPAPISFCVPGPWQRRMIPRWIASADAVVTMMCTGGRATVKRYARETPLVSGMRTVGAANTITRVRLFPFRIEVDAARSAPVVSFADSRRE